MLQTEKPGLYPKSVPIKNILERINMYFFFLHSDMFVLESVVWMILKIKSNFEIYTIYNANSWNCAMLQVLIPYCIVECFSSFSPVYFGESRSIFTVWWKIVTLRVNVFQLLPAGTGR